MCLVLPYTCAAQVADKKGVLPLTWSFTRCVRYHQDAAAYRGIGPGYWTQEAVVPVVLPYP